MTRHMFLDAFYYNGVTYGHILPNTAVCRFLDLHGAQSLTRDS